MPPAKHDSRGDLSKKMKTVATPPWPQFFTYGREIWQQSKDLVDPQGEKNLGSQDPLGGRYGGSNFFFPHPLPQNPLVRFRDFDGFEVHVGPPKNPENFSKINCRVNEIYGQTHGEPM